LKLKLEDLQLDLDLPDLTRDLIWDLPDLTWDLPDLTRDLTLDLSVLTWTCLTWLRT